MVRENLESEMDRMREELARQNTENHLLES